MALFARRCMAVPLCGHLTRPRSAITLQPGLSLDFPVVFASSDAISLAACHSVKGATLDAKHLF